jgi:hypothetical protein
MSGKSDCALFSAKTSQAIVRCLPKRFFLYSAWAWTL